MGEPDEWIRRARCLGNNSAFDGYMRDVVGAWVVGTAAGSSAETDTEPTSHLMRWSHATRSQCGSSGTLASSLQGPLQRMVGKKIRFNRWCHDQSIDTVKVHFIPTNVNIHDRVLTHLVLMEN